MNILIIHEVDWIKKVTYEMHHLSELFSLLGHNVYAIDLPDPGLFFLTGRGPIENYHRVYDSASIMLFRTPIIPIKGLHRVSALLTSHNLINKIAKKYKIDIIMLYSVLTNSKAAIRAGKELGIPIIHRTFDIPHDLIRENFLRGFALETEKSVYPRLNRVIANTQFMKKWAQDMGSRSVDVIPQGVDPNIMKQLEPDVELKSHLGIDANAKVVMYLGSIESFSGLNLFIEKVPEIVNAIPEFSLLVVGGGSQLEGLQRRAEALGISNKVFFTGYRPYLEIPRYCSIAHLCINTFRINEMTDRLSPVKVFDLQACGKAILATPLSGLKADFPEETSGLIYCPLENLHKRVIELLADVPQLTAKGMRGKEFVGKNFVWNRLAEKWISEFEELVAQSN